MGTVFRRKIRGVPSERYSIRYRDANGRLREEAAFTQKGQSRQLLHSREQSAREGRLDGGAYWKRQQRTALADLVAQYVEHLEAKGTGEGQRDRVRAHLLRSFREMNALVAGEATAEAVQRNLVEFLRSGRSVATRNHRLSALRSFWRWGMATKRLRAESDPTVGLALMKAEAARVRPRRALEPEELRALLVAGRERPLARYRENHKNPRESKVDLLRRAGLQRATIYAVGSFAGLRRRELQELKWGDVRLTVERPCIVVRAASAKAKREDLVPLAATAIALLTEWKAWVTREGWGEPKSTAPVFDLVGHGLLKALWADLSYSRVEKRAADGSVTWESIPITTQDGRVDVHALRHTCCTMLCMAGVPASVAQRIMRHRDVRTTMMIYAHVTDAARAGAVELLPRLDLPPVEDRVKAGGGA